MRALVTGAAGFIGSHFVRTLLAKNPKALVVGLDALTYCGNSANLADVKSDRYIFKQGDICDRKVVDELFSIYNINAVIHFAAESHVDRSVLEPDVFVKTNVLGTQTLLEAARHFWQKASIKGHLHHVSTDEVYGSLGPKDPAFTEKTAYDPSSPYSASKAAADHLVRAYHRTYHLPVTISNCSNNFGPNQYPEKLIPLSILRLLEGKPIQLYGDGLQCRDWLYVTDHCEAIIEILKKGTPGETYNVGGSHERTNIEVAQTIMEVVVFLTQKEGPPPIFIKDRPGHDRRYAINFEKLYKATGWLPRHTFAEGIAKTVAWYLKNSAWVDGVRKRKEYADWMTKQYTEAAK